MRRAELLVPNRLVGRPTDLAWYWALLVGWIKDASGNFSTGLAPMVVLSLMAAVITFVIGRAPATPSSS